MDLECLLEMLVNIYLSSNIYALINNTKTSNAT